MTPEAGMQAMVTSDRVWYSEPRPHPQEGSPVEIQPTRASLLFDLKQGRRPEEAWAEFHAQYSDVIHGWCRGRGLRPDVAEDLTQEVLLKLLRELPRYTYNSSRGRFRCWLKTVVSRALIDFHRRQKNHPAPEAP